MDELFQIGHVKACSIKTGKVLSCRKLSKLDKIRLKGVIGGGTNNALPGLVPPIQFCERLNSPGSFPEPRHPKAVHHVNFT